MADANLRTYLQILRRRIGWLLLVTVIAVGAVVGIDEVRTKQYTATAQLLVQPSSTVNNAVTQQTVASNQVLTEMQLLTSTPVKQQVEKVLDLSSLADVPKASTAELGQTNVITVSATGAVPQNAEKIANAYANALVAYEQSATISSQTAAESQLQAQINSLNKQVSALESSSSADSSNATSQLSTLTNQETALKSQLTQLQAKPTSSTAAESQLETQITDLAGQISALQSTTATTSPQLTALLSQEEVLKEELAQLQVNGAVSTGNVQLVSPATLPIAPSSPKRVRDGLVALFLGLVLGAGLALIIEHLDDAIYSKEDAELVGGSPVLAMIPILSSWKAKNHPYLVAVREPKSTVTEAYRSLRTALQFAGHDGAIKSILVTSSSSAEGKSSTVANLGVVLAGTNLRAVLVDCDLRRPRLGQFLDVEDQPGFTAVLLGELSIDEATKPVPGVPNLFVLPSGLIPPNPAELLAGARASWAFQRLQDLFDVVVIDSPPLLPVADALILSEIADATLVVVACGGTAKGELQRAAELLAQVNAKRVGIVLNEVTRRAGYGFGYGYGYESASEPSRNGQSDLISSRNRRSAPAE